MFGPYVGLRAGYITASEDANSPGEVSIGWKAHNSKTGQWENEMLDVTCVCDNTGKLWLNI